MEFDENDSTKKKIETFLLETRDAIRRL